MYDLIEAKYVDGYILDVRFENGKRGRHDFSRYALKGGVFERLSDLSYFKSFYVNKELGVLCWPDGPDIAPETLYHKVTGEPLPPWMTEEKEELVKG
ncbi:MAG TPA: DUF2442 domain-containing protein [Bdellovibrionales bacterium]|nr:DUF2442 domain-containing protein [Bdellovibrionales bacterium]HAS53009.1 DUF2442 domain-containing protein [Nitrospiraceae bacterium]